MAEITEKEFEEGQKSEEISWNLNGDRDKINEKISREKARYPLLIKQMGLKTCINTSKMFIMDIGCGATGGLSTILPYKKRVAVDPLMNEYGKYNDITGMIDTKAEDLKEKLNEPDLIITTNCVDHFHKPVEFLQDLNKYMKYGAYYAHFHAINNHLTHIHPAHKHSVNETIYNEIFNENFETVWYMNFKEDGLTYGWTKQESFLALYRRINQPKF